MIHWTTVQQYKGTKFSCAQVNGWNGNLITIGSVERHYESNGWSPHWSWMPWCDLGKALLNDGTQADEYTTIQQKVSNAWKEKVG